MNEYNFKERKFSDLEKINYELNKELQSAVDNLTAYYVTSRTTDIFDDREQRALKNCFYKINTDEELAAIIEEDYEEYIEIMRKNKLQKPKRWRKNTDSDDLEVIGTALFGCNIRITMKDIEVIKEIADRQCKYAISKKATRKYKHKVMGFNKPDFLTNKGLYKFKCNEKDALYLMFYAVHFNLSDKKELCIYDPLTNIESSIRVKDLPKEVFNRVKALYRINILFDYQPKIQNSRKYINQYGNKVKCQTYNCPCGKGKIRIENIYRNAKLYYFVDQLAIRCPECETKYLVVPTLDYDDWYLGLLEDKDEFLLLGEKE